MKKQIMIVLIVLAALLLPAYIRYPQTRDETGKITDDYQNVLIAYFSWGDNTYPVASGTNEAQSMAFTSVLVPGDTAVIAQRIEEVTGGTLFPIIAAEPYPDSYAECLERVIQEHGRIERPALSRNIDNMENYDVIFIGYPSWWYTCPTVVLAFLEEHDFSGKAVIPFCVYDADAFGASLLDIRSILPDDSVVLDALGCFYHQDIETSIHAVDNWLVNLGF